MDFFGIPDFREEFDEQGGNAELAVHVFGKEVEDPVDVAGVVYMHVHVKVGIAGSNGMDQGKVVGNEDAAGFFIHDFDGAFGREGGIVDFGKDRFSGRGIEQEPV